MLEVTGRISRVSTDLDGRMQITLDVNEPDLIKKNYDKYKICDCIDIKIQKHLERRSNDANAYFHALVREIASALNTPTTQIKNSLIHEYGQPELLEDGTQVTYLSRAPIEYMLCCESIHAYPVSVVGDETVYAIYRGTHTYNTKEMSTLIDGTVLEAETLGIDTKPPEEIKAMKEKWKPKC